MMADFLRFFTLLSLQCLQCSMSNSQPDSQSPPSSPREFTTTHWSVILLAGSATSEDADKALEHLCRAYWYPLYAYVRRQGHAASDAQDLTQDFFARFLERRHFRLADPHRGRFRTFLLSSLKNFLINEWEKSRAAKRGGTSVIFSLDEQDAEGRYLAEPVDGLTPERIYEKRWAVALLDQVMTRLRDQYTANGRGQLFDALKPYIWDDVMADGYDSVSARLGMSDGSLRVAMHRLRESFRELLRTEVACTVESPAEVDEELRHLVAALRN
jgi:RNA polymerase sigma-70 factor (ECF subfamily)